MLQGLQKPILAYFKILLPAPLFLTFGGGIQAQHFTAVSWAESPLGNASTVHGVTLLHYLQSGKGF